MLMLLVSSDVNAPIINECDVLPMHRKKARKIVFATFLDVHGNLAKVMQKSHW